MSDRLGLLQLPATAPGVSPVTNAVGDPLLDVLAAYLQAAVNADTRRLWEVVAPPVNSLPIVRAFTHDPDEGTFSEKTLPALFVWRQAQRSATYTQDWDASDTTIAILWVPPRATYDKQRQRQAFRNAMVKALKRAINAERHPAWVAAGDTDPVASDYGTFILPKLGVSRIQFNEGKPFDLQIDRPDGKGADTYDAVLATVDVRELQVPVLDDYQEIADLRGGITLGAGESALPISAFQFQPTVLAVSPASGPAAGGTEILVTGHQFFEEPLVGELIVRIGTERCTAVELVDGDNIIARTPAGTVGEHPVTVTLPSGATSAPLVGGFTYL